MEHANDNVPVFDRGDALPCIVEDATEWQPSRTRIKGPGLAVKLANDGPSLERRIALHAVWASSNRYSGQHANDNSDWPLAKLLRTEKNDHCLALAERYRALHDAATLPTQLVGREAVDLYVVHNVDEDGKNKGQKVVTGRRANIDTPATRATITNDETKKRAAPIPKKWQGDWPLLASIDAKRELAVLRYRLAYVPKILDAFEWAVVDGLTLTEIGAGLGAGSKGAKGEARARIFDGFGIIDRFWRNSQRAA
ncbi:hypothetical protein [Ensifer sesbaniae]|uniref:hypothetical protein n=1 Tax=Ensifer sesbaniae TaxID=1214071 RepID=UPI0015691BC8|nr:hypothetical protein [Ensifer sesbaniae]NRQ15579.1 hypothetical protein [Ensifer sesbaniae]